MNAKLNPFNNAKISFPGFQEILDFTSAGSEASVSITVDGDTDKEYIIYGRNLNTNDVYLRLNNDSTNGNYGYQHIRNLSGTISAARGTTSVAGYINAGGFLLARLLTPVGFIKTLVTDEPFWTSGTTIGLTQTAGRVYNSTSNITAINFVSASGNFATGTRIYVGVRRSQ